MSALTEIARAAAAAAALQTATGRSSSPRFEGNYRKSDYTRPPLPPLTSSLTPGMVVAPSCSRPPQLASLVGAAVGVIEHAPPSFTEGDPLHSDLGHDQTRPVRIKKQHMLGSEVKALVAASGIPSTKASKSHEANGSRASSSSFLRSQPKTVREIRGDGVGHSPEKVEDWKSLRSDWRPFDPSKSLQQNIQQHEESPHAVQPPTRGKRTPSGFAR